MVIFTEVNNNLFHRITSSDEARTETSHSMYFVKELIYAFETSMNPLLSPLVGSIVSMDDQSLSTGAQHSLGGQNLKNFNFDQLSNMNYQIQIIKYKLSNTNY